MHITKMHSIDILPVLDSQIELLQQFWYDNRKSRYISITNVLSLYTLLSVRSYYLREEQIGSKWSN